jgi:hypothetical protein
MTHVTLSMSNQFTDVSHNTSLSTGIMGGCVTVIVFGTNATRAQHCAGGFQALDSHILNVGAVTAIIVAAPLLSGYDPERVMRWVTRNKRGGRSMFVNRDCRIDLERVRGGADLPSCVSY